jgi:drug/metabolite transporter (DMT)-like permease
MANISMRKLGLLLVLLGALAEVLAILAHRQSRDFMPGMFTSLVWVLILVSPVPMLIGAALLVRSRNSR